MWWWWLTSSFADWSQKLGLKLSCEIQGHRMKPIDWQIVSTELSMALGTLVFLHKTTTVMHQHRARARTRTTANLCKSTPYDQVDPDQKTFSVKVFSNLAIKDYASRAKSQGISQQIAPIRMGNLGRKRNREKSDVSKGWQLYWRKG